MSKLYSKKRLIIPAVKAAFPLTLPVAFSFFMLSFSYGVLMNIKGFSFLYPMCMSAIIFGGSLEFVAISLLLSAFSPVKTFIVAFFIQSRHIFYGLAMLDKYKGLGIKKLFLVYGLCDETFSINCSAEVKEGVDKGYFYFFVTLFNYLYWVTGATFGGIVGKFIHFNTKGLDFIMVSMFSVIFIEQFLKEKKKGALVLTLIGFIASFSCLLLVGKSRFILPSLLLILFLVVVLKKSLLKGYDTQAEGVDK